MPKKAAAKSKKQQADESSEVPFEQLMAELEQTVGALESGNLALHEALEKYENGVKCLKKCYLALQNAEQKIEMLSSIDESGQIHVVPFRDED